MRNGFRPPPDVTCRHAAGGRAASRRVRPALALSLLVALAPLAGAVRAQGESESGKAQYQVAEHRPTYVIYQTPSGETGCREATPAELAAIERGGESGEGLRQINHLKASGAAETEALSAGLTIVLRGTSQLDANPTAKQAFINAAAKWEAIISNQITVVIDVDYGPTFFGEAYTSSNILGATSTSGFVVSYTSVRQRLVNRAPVASAEAALLATLPASSLPTDIGSVSSVFVPPPIMRALGFLGPTPDTDTQAAPVPRIGFNSAFAFDFDPSNGVAFNQTDFDSVAVHEIGHALGFNSQTGAKELDPSRSLVATIWDFYRFRPGAGTAASFPTAPRVLSSGTSVSDPHVHFSGGAEIQLSTGKPDGTGGDDEQASHWKDDAFGIPHIGIMDPTLPRGRHEVITANDLKAIDFFGYAVGAVTAPPAPANDNFSAAQALAGPTGRLTGANTGATKEAGEPSHSPDGNPGGKSVWYRWTAPASGAATFTTGSSALGGASTFDTLLGVYTGPGVGALTSVAKNDDSGSGVVSSTVQFSAVGGTTYMIAVDGWNADEGSVALSWSHTGTTAPANPIDGHAFFVRQHYLDFLSREPEAGEPWTGVLTNCPNPFNTDPAAPSAQCDRLLVSSAFFRSPEFELKGRYAFRFYKVSFGRLPDYPEMVADMTQLTGATGAETVAKRAAFPGAWVQRADFKAAFDSVSNAQFVDTLMGRYGLRLITTFHPSSPEGGTKVQFSVTGMTAALDNGQWTRAQVLRAIADSDEVGAAEFNPSFVAMQYYGYLRRTPEPGGYQAWLNYLNANPADSRTMVNGFVNSTEYRQRFGGQ